MPVLVWVMIGVGFTVSLVRLPIILLPFLLLGSRIVVILMIMVMVVVLLRWGVFLVWLILVGFKVLTKIRVMFYGRLILQEIKKNLTEHLPSNLLII